MSDVYAAVMTGQEAGAISTIQVFGDSAEIVLQKIFKPAGVGSVKFKTGKILLGTITDGSDTIDQVTVGCEGPETFAINCHGNPLIVEMIMQLLQQQGAKLLTADQLLTKTLSAEKSVNTIVLEAKLAQPKAKTLDGTKIIANQIEAGLSRKSAEWLENIEAMPLEEITADAERILEISQTAKLIIYGCTAVITGPPNTGKSTLLNYLAGRQKAIVTNIKGTTRDWVSAQCKIGSLSVELIDTAGLDEKLAAGSENSIEQTAQQKSVQLLANADLVLLVLDNSKTANQLDGRLIEKITERKLLAVLNKSDLPVRLDTGKLPQILSNTVQISAKLGMGIDNLIEKIREICSVADFDLKTAVCFTDRQKNLVKQLQKAKSNQQAASIITELLNGQI